MKNITSTWLSPVSEPTVGSGVLIVPPYLINYGLKKCLGDGAWEQVFLSLAFSASAKAPRCHFPPSPSAAASACLIALRFSQWTFGGPDEASLFPSKQAELGAWALCCRMARSSPTMGPAPLSPQAFLLSTAKKMSYLFTIVTIQVLFIMSICCASIWLTLIS